MTPLMGWISVASQSIAVAYVVPFTGYVFVWAYASFGAVLKPRQVGPLHRSTTIDFRSRFSPDEQ